MATTYVGVGRGVGAGEGGEGEVERVAAAVGGGGGDMRCLQCRPPRRSPRRLSCVCLARVAPLVLRLSCARRTARRAARRAALSCQHL